MEDKEKTPEQLMAELAQLRRRVAELEALEKERSQRDQALRQERDMLQAIIDSIPDHIYVKDRKSRFLKVNEAMYRWFGCDDAAPLLGKTDFDFFTQEHAQQAYDDEQRIMETGQPMVNYEERETWPDAPDTWVSTSKVPFRDSEGRIIGIIGISKDITDKKRTEEALERRTRELARANEELQMFVYVVSHDLQEPLRMISSYLQLLSRRYKDTLDADAQEFIAYAVDGATRMRRLIEDLLAYSRIGTQGKPLEPTDCHRVIAEVLFDLHVAIEENDAVVTYDPLPTVMADRTQLRQVFQNLIGNAIKFRSEKRPEVHIGVERQNDHWVFSVRDNGIGIDPKHAERIFIIFQRVHGREEYPGTGIGLAICKKIVERHGGRIWVESQPGQGATFYFTLPVAASLQGEPL